MFENVIKNKFGFYELKKKPSEEELKHYYSTKYYQELDLGYSQQYPDDELENINNRIQQKYEIILSNVDKANGKLKLLDIGCGEGWALDFFASHSWEVKGIDYSIFGCQNHNPHMIDHLIVGEVSEIIQSLVDKKNHFDVIWLDNVLEHFLDPLLILQSCSALLNNGGLLVIEVPNDFSKLQQLLYNKQEINNPFWVAIPDHISYFNKEGLNAICQDAGFECKDLIADFPIDFDLVNQQSNYIKDRSKGKSSHQARITLDNLFHSISTEHTIQLYRSLANLGMGRQIIGFYAKS